MPEYSHPLGNIPPDHGKNEQDLLASLGLDQPRQQRTGLSAVCDFCERSNAEHPPAWYYAVTPTMPVTVDGVEIEFDMGPLTSSGWVACDQCRAFIERQDFRGLADFMGYPAFENSTPDQFRKIMLGPGQPLEPRTEDGDSV